MVEFLKDKPTTTLEDIREDERKELIGKDSGVEERNR